MGLPRYSLFGWFALVALLVCGACDSKPAPSSPSVLVLVLDSLHAGHSSAHGYARDTTPRFTRFAAAGVRFEQAYSQSSWTLPSTASLFTSLEQERHGVRTFNDALPESIPTLAERLRERGYRTHAIVQTPVLSSRHGLQQGFERYDVLDHSSASLERALELARESWEHRPGEPLLVYLHLAPPHMPYEPPAPFRGAFSTPDSSVSGSISECRRIHRAALAPDHPDVVALAARYDEHIAFADARAGELLEALARSAARPDAWVVWTSDHGEAFQQHGCQGHNATVYDEMLHVPLALARLDGTTPPQLVREPVSTMDVAPTLLELCGARSLGAELAGVSLREALGSGRAPAERLFSYSSRYKDDERQLHFAVRRGALKLVWRGDTGESELYDLASDPGERVDARASHAQACEELQRELERLRAVRIAGAPARTLAPAARPAERARLSELGYVEDSPDPGARSADGDGR